MWRALRKVEPKEPLKVHSKAVALGNWLVGLWADEKGLNLADEMDPRMALRTAVLMAVLSDQPLVEKMVAVTAVATDAVMVDPMAASMVGKRAKEMALSLAATMVETLGGGMAGLMEYKSVAWLVVPWAAAMAALKAD